MPSTRQHWEAASQVSTPPAPADTAKPYLDCAPQQQTEILDLLAYRKNADQDASLKQGVESFSLLRNMTANAFFTSKIGIKYLGYKGNTYLTDFPGCPPVPGI